MESAKIQPIHNEILADEISRLAAHEHREFSWREADDGSIEFFGRLPAELAEKVINAINACEKDVPAETSSSKSALVASRNGLSCSWCRTGNSSMVRKAPASSGLSLTKGYLDAYNSERPENLYQPVQIIFYTNFKDLIFQCK